MLKLLTACSMFLLCACALNKPDQGIQPTTVAITPTSTEPAQAPGRYALIKQRVAEAHALCHQDLQSRAAVHNGKVVGKPVLLCAWSEQHKVWHEVELLVEYPLPKRYERCAANARSREETKDCRLHVRPSTAGYSVTHLYGYGPVLFTAELFAPDGEELIVYAAAHLIIPKAGTTHAVQESAFTVVYSPYSEIFTEPEVIEAGYTFLMNEILAARDELVRLGVRSQAYPNSLLAGAIPWQLINALVFAEQIDPRFAPNLQYEMHRIAVHFALNEGSAFAYTRSSAAALGALQFTNKGGNGTYQGMIRWCGDANLIPHFETGARDLRNAIKAAYCLLDYELSRFAPMQTLYRDDPVRHSCFLAAAYNGGQRTGRLVYKILHRSNFDLATLPSRIGKRNFETPLYCQKVGAILESSKG